MRIITFMKMINCNGWAPRNKVPYEWSAPIPITDPPVDLQVYFAYSREVAWFYYRLGASVIYHFLDKDNYFNEDD
jgi:hypothetical protein